ncbi:formate/nitrite transporter family protein [Sinanaerobacter chloroacetimidivorans]|jgi:formate/nitrite transporter|uniref:Formate/nitrite transporter family protein n=1 Tax=Sinanaerobacter chloroacetimidivorans TaxID=2818044 RepID=A0A8J7W0G8_9FIRM|nr:formate/nitrite transporter family protein [Sinanaerobacter chloroacetimidivorans]MBR0596720.1 formate/nitrite transporter family protein [Sinanaerobacter chloroacetimidivorans]
MDKKPLKPAEILDYTISMAQDKVNGSFSKLLILSVMAGAFIAFAAEGSNMAAFNLFSNPETYGLGKVLAGAVFGTGLMLVVLAGGELFTGNTLILAAICEKKVKLGSMLRNWVIVYVGNLIGSLFIAYMMANSGLFESGAGMLGAVTLKTAVYKVNLDFISALFLGIMCNWLVCLAVWISYGAETMTGKIFAVFFPIWLFITSGFEHSVANMYYIPAGIFVKGNSVFAELAHLSGDALASLSWSSFFLHNLIPVTIGNIIGGGLLVAMGYWYVYNKA